MDYRIGVRGDYKIGLNEVRDGLSLPIFAVELPRFRLPPASLVSSTLHSSLYNADEAVTAGFLDEAVDEIDLEQPALKQAEHLATLPNPPYEQSKTNLIAPISRSNPANTRRRPVSARELTQTTQFSRRAERSLRH